MVIFQVEDVLKKVVVENLDKLFVIVDIMVDLFNVCSVGFCEYEGVYLFGVVVGLFIKMDKVGMIVVVDVLLIKKYIEGFKVGLEFVNLDVEFFVNYVGGFNDFVKVKELVLV